MTDATRQAYESLLEHLRKQALLSAIHEQLGWDELALLPEGASEYRGQQLAYFAGLQHELTCDPRLDEWLFDNSAVDGYALTNGTPSPMWSVVRTIAAGDPPGTALQPGECARIFTGAPTPPNTFAVVMQEDTVTRSGNIEVAITLKEGQHIRRAGEEVQTGEIALAEGTPLFAAGLGSVANLGLSEVVVVPAPRVGIVVTGAEPVAIGEELDPAQIYESNSVVVTSALKSLGLGPEFIRTTGDDPEGP